MAANILVIDDQESARALTALMLKGGGHHVVLAEDGEEGLEIFNKGPEAFNLIIADVNMPKIDGFEFLRRIKNKSPKTPVIFLTGIDENAAKVIGKEYKVDAIIKKPYVVDEALKTIERILSSAY